MAEMPQTSHSMGTARMSGLVLKTGVPLMISLLINSLYNFVDSIFVSRVSEDALTALSLAAPVQILMSAMGLGIAVGLNAVISKALGAQDKEKVERTASAALVLAFLAWILVVILEILAMEVYFKWQSGGNEIIMNYGIPYLRICMIGSLGMMGQWERQVRRLLLSLDNGQGALPAISLTATGIGKYRFILRQKQIRVVWRLCEFCSYGYYAYRCCGLWGMCKNPGTCNRWGKRNGKRPDSDCCLQLRGKEAKKNLSGLPMGNAVFRYFLQCFLPDYGDDTGADIAFI